MARRDWPTNLKCRNGYYSWFNPIDGKEYGLGRDKRAAFAQAVEANLHVAQMRDKPRLIDRMNGTDDMSFAALCDRYDKFNAKQFAEGRITKSTSDSRRQKTNTVRERWGKLQASAVKTKEVAAFIEEYLDAGKERMAQAMRTHLYDLFKEGIAAGWLEINPVENTRGVTVAVERSRLTLEDFLKIHAVALECMPARVARSMELALITGQRREDLRMLGPKMVDDGKLWVVQAKTGNRVCIPLGIRLQAVNWSLSEVIARCRSSKVLSRHFLHHEAITGRAKPGDPIRRPTITAEFAEARDLAGVTGGEGKTPPTFHEIRSLAARLWAAERGEAFAQALLGHKSAEMAALYRDKRGDEWISVPG